MAGLVERVPAALGSAVRAIPAASGRHVAGKRVHGAIRVTEPVFVPEYWNPPSLFELAQRTGIAAMALGAIAAVLCRPDLKANTLAGGVLFLAIYTVFLLGLKWSAPGYIEQV